MSGVDSNLRICVNDLLTDEQRFARLRGSNAVHGETSGQAGHTSKHGLEGLGKMVRDEVFVHLDRGHPRLAFVRDARLAADTHDEIVMVHTIDQVRQ